MQTANREIRYVIILNISEYRLSWKTSHQSRNWCKRWIFYWAISRNSSKHYQKSFVIVIAPPLSNETKSVVENAKKELKKIQARKEEVLTISVVLRWLKEDAE